MTKNERIEKLEREIERLWAHHVAHLKRIEQLEARPQVVNVHNGRPAPVGRAINVWPAWIRAML